MATPAKKLTAADESRGIQNAVSTTSRFARQRQGRTLQAELLAQSTAGRKEATNDSEYERREEGQSSRTRRQFQEAELIRRELEELARTEGVAYEEGNEELLVKNPPEKPPFPGIILSIALLKDLLDAAEITGIGVLITTALSFLIGLVLFLWTLGKLSGGWWKKKLVRKVFIKYGLAITIEFLPVLKLIPTATIFVLMAHYDETKVVRLLNGALERIRSGGLKL